MTRRPEGSPSPDPPIKNQMFLLVSAAAPSAIARSPPIDEWPGAGVTRPRCILQYRMSHTPQPLRSSFSRLAGIGCAANRLAQIDILGYGVLSDCPDRAIPARG